MSDEAEDDHLADGPASGDPLAREAATWFARLRGPDAEQHRPAFEAWLQRGALHLAAYNRAAEIFNMGKLLAEADEAPAPPSSARSLPVGWKTMAVAAAIAMLILAGFWLLASDRRTYPGVDARPLALVPSPEQPLQLATRLGEVRSFGLPDRSRVTLDSDSLVTLSYDEGQRNLRLERGRARFEVVHDPRPFVVFAGGGRVTARGTIFDVSLSKTLRVAVRLLRGRIDVATPAPGAAGSGKVVSLRPGGSIAFVAAPAPPDTSADNRWTEAMAEFDGAPLRDVVARANAASPVKIRLADARTEAIRLSGSFRINDGARLAEQLATLLDLERIPQGGSEILLRKR